MSVMIGLVVSAGVSPGDEMEWSHQVATEYQPGWSLARRDAFIEKTFLITILPALLGVWTGLRGKIQLND